jgi:hypothetical protein
MEATTNKVGIDLELRPDLRKAEGEFNSFINQIVNKVKTLDANLQKLGEGGKLTGAIRKKAEEALYSTTEAAYGFTKGLDPATIAGLGGERAISTAIGANIAKPLKEAQGTLRKDRDDMDSAIVDTERAMSKHTRMIPAYLGTVINTVGQAVQMYANLYRAEKLAFDFSSPAGMATSLMQYDIQKTQTLWGGGGRTLGSVAGGIIGFGFGGVAGSLAGSYLGSQILGEAGSAIGIFATADREQKMKMFQQGYSRSATAAQAITPIESMLYNIMSRSGGKLNYTGASSIIKGNADLGFAPAQSAQIFEAYSKSGGRPEDFRSFLEFSRAERGSIEGYTAMMTPKSQAEQAFMFSALRTAKPKSSLLDIQLMMRGGINDADTRKAMLNAIAGVPKGLRDYYILAMTEGKGVGAGVTRDIMKEFDSGSGAFGADKILQKALKSTSGGETAESKIGVAQYELGETIKASIRQWNVVWETEMSSFLRTARVQDQLTSEIENALKEFKSKFFGGEGEKKDSGDPNNFPVGSTMWQEAMEIKQGRDKIKEVAKKYDWEHFGEKEIAEKPVVKEDKAGKDYPIGSPEWNAMMSEFESKSNQFKLKSGGSIKVDTRVQFIPEKSGTSSSNKRPVKVASK